MPASKPAVQPARMSRRGPQKLESWLYGAAIRRTPKEPLQCFHLFRSVTETEVRLYPSHG